MAFQILLNLFLAFIWMFLQTAYDGPTFTIGYLLGLLIILGFRKFFGTRFYLMRVFAVLRLLTIFLKELVLSNISVLKVILKPKLDIKPGIFALTTDLEKEWEITIFANLITLTPGTLVIDISDDNKTLYIHAMDLSDGIEETIKGIKGTFENAIKEVSR